jgi:hypothetical protein
LSGCCFNKSREGKTKKKKERGKGKTEVISRKKKQNGKNNYTEEK